MRSRALAAVKNNDWEKAAIHYRRLLAKKEFDNNENLADDASNLGAILRKLGLLAEAAEHYQRWLIRYPSHQTLRMNGINCLFDLEKLDLASQWINSGLQQSPNDVGMRQAHGRLMLAKGNLSEGRRILEAITRSNPDNFDSWLELSVACHRLGDQTAALNASRQACRIAPKNSSGWVNQINLLRELGHLNEAEALISNLAKPLSQQPEIRRVVADLWIEQQLMEEAQKELEALCKLQPQDAGHWVNRAACLRHLKHSNAAASVLKKGLQWSPDDLELKESLGHCLGDIGMGPQAIALLRQTVHPVHNLSEANFLGLQFLGAGYKLISSQERAKLARGWEQRKRLEGIGPLWADRIRTKPKTRRLRVGYFSADFCNHPVGRFTLPLLQNHDHSQIELWGLSCGPHKDDVSEQLKDCCDHWLELRYGKDHELARVIADQQLDVIVELSGYTANSRISVLVHRPAQIQLSYLGFPAPTYLDAIDGWIGDHTLFGELNTTDKQAHQLIMIEGGYMVFSESKLPEPTRAKTKRFRFGSFNHSRKLSQETIALFCKVMAAVPSAELVLKSVGFAEQAEQERVKALFIREGLDRKRLIILPWIEGRFNHMANYKEMDVALDPIPYGGATTSCEALIMGVPVVTLAGKDMVSRLSASILESAKLSKWIADKPETYIQIATQLANHGPRTSELRRKLRSKLQKSDLMNGKRLAEQIEQHFQALVKERSADCR